jgi:hypothetical protein
MDKIAVGIVIAVFVYVGVLLPLGRLTLPSASIFLVAGIFAAFVIPNFGHISHLLVKAGQYFSVSVDAQQAAESAHSDAADVRQIKEQMQALAKRIADSDTRISQSERDVAQMQANVRNAYRALFDTLVVSLDTRNIFPPPPPATDEMNRQLNILATFAFPDPIERKAEWDRDNAVGAMQPPNRTPQAH